MEGVIVLVLVLAAATVFGLWRKRVDGRIVEFDDAAAPGMPSAPAPAALTATDLDHQLGDRATFVQFSTAFCQPCRANRQVLSHLVRTHEGLAHIEIDAESHLDLVRRLGVTRTPTTLVLDATGAIRRRAVGPLKLADAELAAAEVATSG